MAAHGLMGQLATPVWKKCSGLRRPWRSLRLEEGGELLVTGTATPLEWSAAEWRLGVGDVSRSRSRPRPWCCSNADAEANSLVRLSPSFLDEQDESLDRFGNWSARWSGVSGIWMNLRGTCSTNTNQTPNAPLSICGSTGGAQY